MSVFLLIADIAFANKFANELNSTRRDLRTSTEIATIQQPYKTVRFRTEWHQLEWHLTNSKTVVRLRTQGSNPCLSASFSGTSIVPNSNDYLAQFRTCPWTFVSQIVTQECIMFCVNRNGWFHFRHRVPHDLTEVDWDNDGNSDDHFGNVIYFL